MSDNVTQQATSQSGLGGQPLGPTVRLETCHFSAAASRDRAIANDAMRRPCNESLGAPGPLATWNRTIVVPFQLQLGILARPDRLKRFSTKDVVTPVRIERNMMKNTR